MENNEIRFWVRIKGFIILLLLSVITVYAFCPKCWSFEFIPWKSLLQSATIWLLLGYGNSFISSKLDQKFSWIHHTFKRFAIGFLAMVTYTTLAVYAQALFFSWLFENSFIGTDDFYYSFVTALLRTYLNNTSPFLFPMWAQWYPSPDYRKVEECSELIRRLLLCWF